MSAVYRYPFEIEAILKQLTTTKFHLPYNAQHTHAYYVHLAKVVMVTGWRLRLICCIELGYWFSSFEGYSVCM